MQFPTGGTAHEPQGMIRCNSEADSTVWMKEDDKTPRSHDLRVFAELLRPGMLAFRGFFVGKCAYFSILSHALNPKVRGIFFCRNEAVFYEPFG